MKQLDIAVIICTLNNSRTIQTCIECIKRNNPKDILIVDGNSTDNTVTLAKDMKVRVLSYKRGVAGQRQFGIEHVKALYTAFVDADDYLEKNCLSILLKELKENKYDAIQAMTLSHDPKTYWQKAMHYNLKLFISKPGSTNMVGRPALYDNKVFKKLKYDPLFTYNGEDSDFSIQMEKNGLKQGIGTGISHRAHLGLESLSVCIKKWLWYGQGDGKLAFKYPDKFWKIVHHLLINYPIKRSYLMIKSGHGEYIFFTIFQGWFRFMGFAREYIRLYFDYSSFKK